MHRFFRLAAPGCLILLAILSWLPADEMIRTGADGRIEHFIAYISTAFGPPPQNAATIAWAGLLGGLLTAALGYWIDRHRSAKG